MNPLHKFARTTEAIRREIQQSKESIKGLAQRCQRYSNVTAGRSRYVIFDFKNQYIK